MKIVKSDIVRYCTIALIVGANSKIMDRTFRNIENKVEAQVVLNDIYQQFLDDYRETSKTSSSRINFQS